MTLLNDMETVLRNSTYNQYWFQQERQTDRGGGERERENEKEWERVGSIHTRMRGEKSGRERRKGREVNEGRGREVNGGWGEGGRTDGRTDRRTDGGTDRPTVISWPLERKHIKMNSWKDDLREKGEVEKAISLWHEFSGRIDQDLGDRSFDDHTLGSNSP